MEIKDLKIFQKIKLTFKNKELPPTLCFVWGLDIRNEDTATHNIIVRVDYTTETKSTFIDFPSFSQKEIETITLIDKDRINAHQAFIDFAKEANLGDTIEFKLNHKGQYGICSTFQTEIVTGTITSICLVGLHITIKEPGQDVEDDDPYVSWDDYSEVRILEKAL